MLREIIRASRAFTAIPSKRLEIRTSLIRGSGILAFRKFVDKGRDGFNEPRIV
jgi:hypothetical protein